jgi:arylsulfatase A-like enzyme
MHFEGPTSLVDISPTLLNKAGIKTHQNVNGRDHNNTVPQDRIILIESTRHGHERKATYKENWKLIVSRGDDQEIGFKLPKETPTELPSCMKTELLDALPGWPDGEENRRVTGEVREQLEDLGYA